MSAKVPEGMLEVAVAAAIEAGKSMNRRQWTEFFSGTNETKRTYSAKTVR